MSKTFIFGKIYIYDFPLNISCCQCHAKKKKKIEDIKDIHSRYKLITKRPQGMLLSVCGKQNWLSSQ